MRAAMTCSPAASKRRYTSPIRLRDTPSGLTMERVRSSAIREDLLKTEKALTCGRSAYRPFSKSLKSLEFNAKDLHAPILASGIRGAQSNADGGGWPPKQDAEVTVS